MSQYLPCTASSSRDCSKTVHSEFITGNANTVDLLIHFRSMDLFNPGFVYILINPSLPGLVKIGKTTRSSESRAMELSAPTGLPTPFIVAFDEEFDDCDA